MGKWSSFTREGRELLKLKSFFVYYKIHLMETVYKQTMQAFDVKEFSVKSVAKQADLLFN